ncbi:MAG TPA: endonuclease MutS2 [Candidatus Gallacutalibacter stercoravium]|nr:endonuclease MutS2 [Candidatus Gallacutalibacter stercoravium]
MVMENRHWRALELDKVLAMLAEETSCEDAYAQALALQPAQDLLEVKLALQQTDDAYRLIGGFGTPSFGKIKNMTNALRRAEAGGVLSMLELLRIGETLRVQRSLVEWRKHCEGVETSIDWRFEALSPNKYLEDKIAMSILSEEEMADTASPELASIRRKIQNASMRVKEQLDKLIRSSTYQKYLQDPIVTLRDGRYVVPVKAESRGNVPGLVHDTSASGATLFVEPMGVVEANNEIRMLQSQEKAEIERILAQLSAEAGGFADSIIEGYQAAVELNVIFAKARLAYQMKASLPVMNDDGKIELKKARHPLIDPHKVVPTDIELGLHFDTLVITGPNTGGKTVALKTVGLLTLMAECGLMIPAGDNSRLSVFAEVLADIGDEQSIEQSLSTFSSHMVNIKQILQVAGEQSLVLLDELGAGTDPVEGAALAMAIIEALRGQGAKMAATTHYAELKAYALQTTGVENACCEFDVTTLRPTYRLLIGVPGRSNAFAISERLGIPAQVVQRAKEMVSAENAKFEDVVQSLETSRQQLEEERGEAAQLRAQAQQLQQEAQRKLDELKRASEAELDRARTQARDLVARARAQSDALLNELEELRKQKKPLDSSARARLKAGIRSMEDAADPVNRRRSEDYVLPRPLKVGDTVLIFDIDKKGTVLALPDNSGQVTVQAGIIKTKVPLSNLRLLESDKKPELPAVRSGRNMRNRLTAPVATELDLRGKTAMEAIQDLDGFIDAAMLSGVNMLTVIHGKGTGVLRKAVQEHLRHHPAVKSYRLGTFGEGESGVTVVELK